MSAPFIYQFYMDSVMSIFRYVTIVVGNDEVSSIQFSFNLILIKILFHFRKPKHFLMDKNGI